jgi:hypothetical protein
MPSATYPASLRSRDKLFEGLKYFWPTEGSPAQAGKKSWPRRCRENAQIISLLATHKRDFNNRSPDEIGKRKFTKR